MQPRRRQAFLGWTGAASLAGLATAYAAAGPQVSAPAANEISIASDTCTSAKLGSEVPVDRIGEPVRRVTLAAPTWTPATATSPAYCRVDGVIEPVDTAATARPINFAVVLPAPWSRRAAKADRAEKVDRAERVDRAEKVVQGRHAPADPVRRPTTGHSTTKRSPISATCR